MVQLRSIFTSIIILGILGSGTLAISAESVLVSSDLVEAFYRAHDNRPVWTLDHRDPAAITEFMALLEEVADEGLDPRDFHTAELKDLLNSRDLWGSAEAQAQLDLLLTDAYFTLGRQLGGVRVDPTSFHEKWLTSPRGDDPQALLQEALAGTDNPVQVLAAMRPTDPSYANLCAALVRYRARETDGGWVQVPEGPTLRPGEMDSTVSHLRQRLAVEDEAVSLDSELPLEFNDELVQAVRRFQFRHGLACDGVVGPATRAALNVTVAERVTQIALNLERQRWLRLNPEERSILVNIPAFQLQVLEEGEEVLSMRAVVGRRDRPTPVMSGAVTYLELNPTWNIPQKLFRNDVLPHILGDPDYLSDQNIRVFESWRRGAPEIEPSTVAWDSIPPWDLAFKLQQEPGPKNPLGRVKFMFSNPFSVYLHDTPGKSKFNQTERCFSSGCVRIEDPLALATFLLEGGSTGDRDSLLSTIATGKIARLGLPTSVPVHLVYQTAWADDSGVVHFRNDVYGYDATLEVALAELGSGSDDLPGADGTGIEVHELQAGIISHAASAQVEGRAPQILVSHTGQPQVYGLAREVETLTGSLVSGSPE